MNDYLMIGEVLKPQGVRGECKIRSYAADIDRFHDWKTLYRRDGEGYAPVSVRTARIRDGFVYAFLDGSASADDAEKFRGTELFVDRAHAAPAEDIVPLAQRNIDKVNEIAERVFALCAEPRCFEAILQQLFRDYALPMNFEQYVLVGSTLRSYLAWLRDMGKLAPIFEDSMLLWTQAE